MKHLIDIKSRLLCCLVFMATCILTAQDFQIIGERHVEIGVPYTYAIDMEGDFYYTELEETPDSNPAAATITSSTTDANGNLTSITIVWSSQLVTQGFDSLSALVVTNDFEVLYGNFYVSVATPMVFPDPLDPNQNYVKTTSYVIPSTIANLSTVTGYHKIENISYIDGIGRPLQQIAVAAGGSGEDIVTPYLYDGYGRPTKTYLPYAVSGTNDGALRTTPIQEVHAFYDTNKYESINNPFSESMLESNVLARPLEQGAPGNDWQILEKIHPGEILFSNTIKFERTSNTANEVKLYNVTFTGGNKEAPQLADGGHYQEGYLYKSITKDENWKNHSGKNHTTEEFKDILGRVILKRTYTDYDANMDGDTDDTGEQEVPHDTYYVYDYYGNLTYVLPPKVDTSDGVSATELSELCYQYKYDGKNRLIEKKIPGRGWEYIVYDNLDRPVLTQNANQLGANSNRPWGDEWSFTKYDILGRVIYTGSFQSNNTRAQLQSTFNAKTATQNYETKLGTAGFGNSYYSNNNYPNTFIELFTINYYDDYVFDTVGGQTAVTNAGHIVTSNAHGLSTGSKVRVMGSSGSLTNDWVTTVNYFDEKGRTIYTYSKNEHLDTVDDVKLVLDFTNKVTFSTEKHTKGTNATITTTTINTYDRVGRLLLNELQIGNTPPENIVRNHYDEMGQLDNKKVGGSQYVNTANGLQTIDYSYNIRGWLKGINEDGFSDNDLFNFMIRYNNPTSGTPLYNGNISQVSWNTASTNTTGNPVSSSYTYNYDALNRIISGVDNTGNYNLDYMAYDKNGNITKLKRKGHTNASHTSFGLMDDLTYSYNSGNELQGVSDAVGNYGFKDDTNNSLSDYGYDANGNMQWDFNKDIFYIQYDNIHTDLPTIINMSGGNISYIYDAVGTKLKKTVNGSSTTEYAGNYVYENGSLKFFNHAEGYVEPLGNDTYKFIYQYKDHLGNVRLSYSDNDYNGTISASEILEENNYYPFGLKHKGYNGTVSANNNSVASKFKYNGKELQDELGLDWYDLGARNHDPVLGRFMNIDPLAEDYMYQSTYAMAANNPIYHVDINGMGVLDDYGIDKKTGNITLIKKTDDKTDTLYAGTGEGESFVKDESKGSVTVNQYGDGSSLISDLSIDKADVQTWEIGTEIDPPTEKVNVNITHTDGSKQDDAFNVFKFVADNSNVEWSLHKFGLSDGSSRYQLGTYHKDDLSPGFDTQNGGDWLGAIHSHPNIKNTFSARLNSLYGDRSVGSSYLKKYGRNLPYLIYFPSSGKVSKIKSLNNELIPDAVSTKHNIKNYKF